MRAILSGVALGLICSFSAIVTDRHFFRPPMMAPKYVGPTYVAPTLGKPDYIPAVNLQRLDCSPLNKKKMREALFACYRQGENEKVRRK